jgi:hypothetical protein
MENESIFEVLNKVDVRDKIKQKNSLNYLSWASAWTEVKKRYPDATYRIIPQIIEGGNTRFWHDDGKTGWVEVEVTIENTCLREVLAIMDFKNKSIPAESITSVDANKSVKRCLTKCLALHGLGLFIFEGEDMPEETSKVLDLQESIRAVATKKAGLSDKAKAQVAEYCKAAEKEANPSLPDDAIRGDFTNINDIAILETLHKRLMAIRK